MRAWLKRVGSAVFRPHEPRGAVWRGGELASVGNDLKACASGEISEQKAEADEGEL